MCHWTAPCCLTNSPSSTPSASTLCLRACSLPGISAALSALLVCPFLTCLCLAAYCC
jgi:hypothetical protein